MFSGHIDDHVVGDRLDDLIAALAARGHAVVGTTGSRVDGLSGLVRLE